MGCRQFPSVLPTNSGILFWEMGPKFNVKAYTVELGYNELSGTS